MTKTEEDSPREFTGGCELTCQREAFILHPTLCERQIKSEETIRVLMTSGVKFKGT